MVEMAVVLAVIVVLAIIGHGSLGPQLPRFRTVKAAKQLQGDLVELRELAINTNRETRLKLVSSPGSCEDGETWGGEWLKQIGNSSRNSTRWDTLPEDMDEDGVDDDPSLGHIVISKGGNREQRHACLRQWSPLAGPSGAANSDSVVFTPRGWVRNPATDFGSMGSIDLTLVNVDSVQRGSADEIHVQLTRAGLVRMISNRSDEVSVPVGTPMSSTASP